jgi:hypothetical protein
MKDKVDIHYGLSSENDLQPKPLGTAVDIFAIQGD